MTFGEKLRQARRRAGLTQEALALRVGLQRRAILQYENGHNYPRSRETYEKLASALAVDVNHLITEEAPESVQNNAERVIAEVRGLFAGGHLSEEDRDRVMKALQEAYWSTKQT